MQRKAINITLCALLATVVVLAAVPANVSAEIYDEWVATYPSLKFDGANAIAVGPSGNIYVAGMAERHYATVAYDTNGNELWVAIYDGPLGRDEAEAIAIGPSGNIYVTGTSWGSETDTSYDYATVAYDSSGTELWVARYNGPGNHEDYAYDIVVDSSDNVYVTGSSYGIGTWEDYATVAYDSNGNELWVARYNGPGNGVDKAYAIALDSSGNAYVTGTSWGIGTGYDYATVAYGSNGIELWVARCDDGTNAFDIALDSLENIYVAGMGATVAYDSDGNELWTGSHGGVGLAIDPITDNIYVAESNGVDYVTASYDSFGTERWVETYNWPGDVTDYPEGIVLDSSGNVYVTGAQWYHYCSFSMCWMYPDIWATIAYDSDGGELWTARYATTPANGPDGANGIATDLSGNVFVCGHSGGDFTTVGYLQNPSPTTIDDYIQDLPDDYFKNPNSKAVFGNKLDVVEKMIDDGNYKAAIEKLESDILDKVDKWVTDEDAQKELYDMIDALITYLEGLL